jgi:restriction endonuclease S subunit
MVKKVPLGKLLIEQKERIGTKNAGGLPLLGVNNKVGLHRSTGNKIKDLSNYKVVQRNWFAYNPMRINVGSLGLALTDEQVGVVSPDYVVFSCGENLSPHYLYRFLKSLTGMIEIRRNTTGTVRERLYFKSLAKIEIPLPSITKQVDISNKLKSTEIILEKIIDKNSQQLDTIVKMRQAILQLAVQGKLVPQDPKDEPASVLLEKIKAEKENLIIKGKIKKSKPLPPIKPDKTPYILPKGWEWQNLESIFYPISVGKNKIKTSDIEMTGMFPVVDQGKQYVSGFYNKNEKVIKIPGPVIIFGDHTRELKLVDFDFVAGADGVKILRPLIINENYFFIVLKSLAVENRGYGRHYKLLLNNLFPLPPLSEQKRIVAKVDELMALCDELESSLSKSQTDCDRLMEAAVGEILAA